MENKEQIKEESYEWVDTNQEQPKAKRKTQTKAATIPKDIWNTTLRKGIYKLYPNKTVEIGGKVYINTTKELIKLEQGKKFPKGVNVVK